MPNQERASEPAGLWIGGPIIDFDPKQYVRPRKALKVMCREIQTAFAATQLAIENAGLSDCVPADPDGRFEAAGHRHGVRQLRCFMVRPPRWKRQFAVAYVRMARSTVRCLAVSPMKKVLPLWMLKYLPNMPACHVGISINAHGPNNSLILGDVSGPAAVIEAASCIDRGIAQVMISGGSGTRINTTRMNYRNDLPVADVSDPIENSSRPHDPASTGVVGGEGAAALVLEHRDHATRRGAKPIARFTSYASRFVASKGMSRPIRSVEATIPGMRGSAEAIRLAIDGAIDDAGLSSDEIGLVVSNAAGDPLVDAAEREALESTVPAAPVTAPSAALGHTGAAIGSIGLVVGALALANETIPPTLGAGTSSAKVGFRDCGEPLVGEHVLCLAHTSEGSATAIILSRP